MVLRCSGSALRFEGPMLASGRRTGLLLFGLLSDMLKDEKKSKQKKVKTKVKQKVTSPTNTATRDTIALLP